MTRITKHHGLGNDFLVLWDDEPVPDEPVPDLAVRWCDRRRGIGADGLLVATADPADGVDVGMVLYNADGSRAEMSGNGIRCLAQAAMRRFGRTSGVLTVATDAGLRLVQVVPSADPHSVLASVDMGAVERIEPPATWGDLACDPMRPVAHLGLGNPHAVVGVEDVDAVPLAALGSLVPMVNLEVVAPGPEPDAITMRVHERGAGITEACGTGACAAAWAAASWGLVPASIGEITVHMVGGDARVALNQPTEGNVTLVGPATYIGAVDL